MALGKKTGGRNFEPGVVTNPNGRPKLPEDIKEARKLNKEEIERLLNSYLGLTQEELKSKLQDPKTPTLELLMARIVVEAIKKGDERRLDFLLNRLIGPVPKSLDVKSEDGSGFRVVIEDYVKKNKDAP